MLEGLPLSPAQIRSIVESRHAPLALWSGAVSSGKTIASLIAFLLALAEAPDRGLIVIVGRTIQTIERNIVDPLQSAELFGALAAQVHHTTGANTATILGRTVHLVGAGDAKAEGRIRGATIALAYVDEATLVPSSFWLMLLSRLRVGDRSRLLATTNPDGPGHWLRKDFILRATDVGLAWWHFTLDDNPSLDAGFVARLKRQYVGLWYRRFILGEWCMAEGAVYDMWNPAQHVVPAAALPFMTRWLSVGVDYGTRNASAALLLGLGEDHRLYLVDEWRHDSRTALRQLTDGQQSEYLRGWLKSVEHPQTVGPGRGVNPEYVAIDPSALSFSTQLWQDNMLPGADTLNVVNADNDVLGGIRQVSTLLGRDQLRISDRCVGWIDEVGGYSWDEKAAIKGEDKPVKAADHSLDAGRYAVATTNWLWRGYLIDREQLEAA